MRATEPPLSRAGRIARSVCRVALITVLGAGAAAAQTETLRLASTPWSPFTNERGLPRYALDLVEVALIRAGVAAETTMVEESRLTPVLLAGEFEGSGALWRDDERERALLYSDAYLENRLLLVGRSGSDVSVEDVAQVEGRVALIEGYAYGASVHEAPGITPVAAASLEDSLRQVLDGEADYALMDELVIEYIRTNHPEEADRQLAIGQTPLVTRTLHFAVRRDHPDAASIVERFNDELTGMIADRSYHHFLHVDWIRADVDGDGRDEFVPRADRAGAVPPDRSYQLFSKPLPEPEQTQPRRFYVGGDIYEDWSNVPDQYKAPSADPQPGQYTATLFRFTW